MLEHGEIVERGTHQELLALGGRYRTLYDKQYTFETRSIHQSRRGFHARAGGGEDSVDAQVRTPRCRQGQSRIPDSNHRSNRRGALVVDPESRGQGAEPALHGLVDRRRCRHPSPDSSAISTGTTGSSRERLGQASSDRSVLRLRWTPSSSGAGSAIRAILRLLPYLLPFYLCAICHPMPLISRTSTTRTIPAAGDFPPPDQGSDHLIDRHQPERCALARVAGKRPRRPYMGIARSASDAGPSTYQGRRTVAVRPARQWPFPRPRATRCTPP